jgi:hypothetical protein
MDERTVPSLSAFLFVAVCLMNVDEVRFSESVRLLKATKVLSF